MPRAGSLTWSALVILTVGCSPYRSAGEPEAASAQIDGVTLTVSRRAAHPFLAEYDRAVAVAIGDSIVATDSLMIDSGGNRRIVVYRQERGGLLLVSAFGDRYRVDLTASDPILVAADSATGRVVGAFEEDSTGRWGYRASVGDAQ
jgi:hypothetical protein